MGFGCICIDNIDRGIDVVSTVMVVLMQIMVTKVMVVSVVNGTLLGSSFCIVCIHCREHQCLVLLE